MTLFTLTLKVIQRREFAQWRCCHFWLAPRTGKIFVFKVKAIVRNRATVAKLEFTQDEKLTFLKGAWHWFKGFARPKNLAKYFG